MKKLMIALCAVAMAVGAQAGSIKWSINPGGVKDWNGTSETTMAANTTMVYFMLSSQMTNVENAIKKGESFASYILDSGKTTGSNGQKSTSAQITNASLPLEAIPDTDPQQYKGVSTAFRVLVVEKVGEDTWYKFSGEVNKDTYWEGAETPVPTTAQFTSTAWGKGTEWTKVSTGPTPIPEPTSGLLLLLGVAGLALKRKRA